jgi:hypothetical protein
MLYVDSSALLKRYVEEADSDAAEAHLLADPEWVTGRHSYVEIRRNLARLELEEPGEVRDRFEEDWELFTVIEIDQQTTETAAAVAESTGVRTLDALHLGAALRLGSEILNVLTFDVRQAVAARSLGFRVLGI